MSLSVETLQDEVVAFLRARKRLFEAEFSDSLLPDLLAAFDSVWRQVVHEYEVVRADERETISTLAADAIITLAQAGVTAEDIQRYALAHVLFMTMPRRDSAPLM